MSRLAKVNMLYDFERQVFTNTANARHTMCVEEYWNLKRILWRFCIKLAQLILLVY